MSSRGISIFRNLLAAIGALAIIWIAICQIGLIKPPSVIAVFQSPSGRFALNIRRNESSDQKQEVFIEKSGPHIFYTAYALYIEDGVVYSVEWINDKSLKMFVSDDFKATTDPIQDAFRVEFVRLKKV